MNFANFSIVFLTISSLALITSCDPLSGFYEWKDLLPNYVLPDNAVYGGQNVDLQPLFVARGKGSYFSYYGKVHMPIINRSAYLTNENMEFSTTEFQVRFFFSFVTILCQYFQQVLKKIQFLEKFNFY